MSVKSFSYDKETERQKKLKEEAAKTKPKTSSIGETVGGALGGIVGLAVGGGSGVGMGTNIGGGLGGLFDAAATEDNETSDQKASDKTRQLLGGVGSAIAQSQSNGSTSEGSDVSRPLSVGSAITQPQSNKSISKGSDVSRPLSDEEIDSRLRSLFARQSVKTKYVRDD